ncbi:MAG: hypothetical protein HQM10_26440 [Candidatus Riflebacteria bacterium]|nr:hypothetical protein [Candidatus Riflebacteria bacterium]
MPRFRNGQPYRPSDCFHCYFLILLFLLSFSLSLEAADNQQIYAAYIDSRLLLVGHPLVKNYDPSTKRFSETSTECSPDRDAAFKEYFLKIQKLKQELKAEDEKIKSQPGNSKKEIKENLEKHWVVKNEILAKLSYLKKAAESASSNQNYLTDSKTSDESFVQTVKKICADIRDVAGVVSQKSGGIPVFDLSAFSDMSISRIPDRRVLFTNYHYMVWSNKGDTNYLKFWLRNFRYFLEKEFPEKFHSPFISGVADLRNQALRNMNFSQ